MCIKNIYAHSEVQKEVRSRPVENLSEDKSGEKQGDILAEVYYRPSNQEEEVDEAFLDNRIAKHMTCSNEGL